MSLEQKIEELTAAVTALTAAMKAGGAAPASAKATKAEKPAAAEKPAGYEAKHSREEMQAALGEVKEKCGTPAAKAIIKDVGGVDKMAEITDPKVIDKVYEAAKAKLEEADEGM
jgi:hypothetical protein